jgi:tRNA A37 methylthiotransferase MiaB
LNQQDVVEIIFSPRKQTKEKKKKRKVTFSIIKEKVSILKQRNCKVFAFKQKEKKSSKEI